MLLFSQFRTIFQIIKCDTPCTGTSLPQLPSFLTRRSNLNVQILDRDCSLMQPPHTKPHVARQPPPIVESAHFPQTLTIHSTAPRPPRSENRNGKLKCRGPILYRFSSILPESILCVRPSFGFSQAARCMAVPIDLGSALFFSFSQ